MLAVQDQVVGQGGGRKEGESAERTLRAKGDAECHSEN